MLRALRNIIVADSVMPEFVSNIMDKVPAFSCISKMTRSLSSHGSLRSDTGHSSCLLQLSCEADIVPKALCKLPNVSLSWGKGLQQCVHPLMCGAMITICSSKIA